MYGAEALFASACPPLTAFLGFFMAFANFTSDALLKLQLFLQRTSPVLGTPGHDAGYLL